MEGQEREMYKEREREKERKKAEVMCISGIE